jgi:FkbM family methyltransferase
VTVLSLLRRFLADRSAMTAKLAHVVAYLRAFGVVGGLRARFALLTGSGTLRVQIPQAAAPIWVRSGTSDVEAFDQVFVQRAYAPPVPIRPHLIIDGGANAGYASVYFAATFPAAHVVAVEPERSNVTLLERNTAPYGNVTVVEAAIWDAPGEVRIANPEAAKFEFRVDSNGEGAAVRSLTIPQLLADADADEIDILKLDIEGAEQRVFADASEWLGRVKLAFVEVHDHLDPRCSATLQAAVAPFQFDVSHRGEHVLLVARELTASR